MNDAIEKQPTSHHHTYSDSKYMSMEMFFFFPLPARVIESIWFEIADATKTPGNTLLLSRYISNAIFKTTRIKSFVTIKHNNVMGVTAAAGSR